MLSFLTNSFMDKYCLVRKSGCLILLYLYGVCVILANLFYEDMPFFLSRKVTIVDESDLSPYVLSKSFLFSSIYASAFEQEEDDENDEDDEIIDLFSYTKEDKKVKEEPLQELARDQELRKSRSSHSQGLTHSESIKPDSPVTPQENHDNNEDVLYKRRTTNRNRKVIRNTKSNNSQKTSRQQPLEQQNTLARKEEHEDEDEDVDLFNFINVDKNKRFTMEEDEDEEIILEDEDDIDEVFMYDEDDEEADSYNEFADGLEKKKELMYFNETLESSRVLITHPSHGSTITPNFVAWVNLLTPHPDSFNHHFGDSYICLRIDNDPFNCWPLASPRMRFANVGLGMHTMEGVLLHPKTGKVLMETRAGEDEIFAFLETQEEKDQLEIDELQEKYSRFTQLKKIVFHVEEDIEGEDMLDDENFNDSSALIPEGLEDLFGNSDSMEEPEMIVIGTPLVTISSPEEKSVIDLDNKSDNENDGVTSNGIEVEFLIVVEEEDVEKFWRLFTNEYICIEIEQNYAGSACWPVNLLRGSSIMTTKGTVAPKYVPQKNEISGEETFALEMEENASTAKSFAPYIVGLPNGIHSIAASLTNPSTGKCISETISGSISFVLKKLSPYEYFSHETKFWDNESKEFNGSEGDVSDDDILDQLSETVLVSTKTSTWNGGSDTMLTSLGSTLENNKKERANTDKNESKSKKRFQKSKSAQNVKPVTAINVEIEIDGIDKTLTVVDGQDLTELVTRFCKEYYYEEENDQESDGSCEEEVSLLVHEAIENNKKAQETKQLHASERRNPQVPRSSGMENFFAGSSV